MAKYTHTHPYNTPLPHLLWTLAQRRNILKTPIHVPSPPPYLHTHTHLVSVTRRRAPDKLRCVAVRLLVLIAASHFCQPPRGSSTQSDIEREGK